VADFLEIEVLVIRQLDIQQFAFFARVHQSVDALLESPLDSNQIVALQNPPLPASMCTLLELKTAVTVDALRQE
jgi:hypothetical protein